MTVKNKVQLITYPDSLGGSLKGLDEALSRFFPALFQGGIHILPPFPSSGDRGFAPLTYLEIDPAFGTWDDIRRLGERYDILLDLMVNHISSKSPFFVDFLTNGRASEWADLFITLDKYWPGGQPAQQDVDRMFLRRQRPYSTFKVGAAGIDEKIWTTFGKTDPSEQIDLDWKSPLFKGLVAAFIDNFSRQGVKIVRLDAVGYLIKKLGTSCFFVEPEIYEFMDWISAMASTKGITLLPEVHAQPAIQSRLSQHGYWTYDFILPYTILEALIIRSPIRLRPYLLSRSAKQFTMLDCHDGVPVKPDMDGLYAPEDVRCLVQTCLDRGANLSLVVSPEHQDPDGFDVHQIRGTYYSLLGCDDDAYIAARAIQFFVPGVPQVYYVGLLAGQNDVEAVARSGEGREINRHNYGADEIEAAVRTDVVRRLDWLIRLRNQHPAFDGEFRVLDSDAGRLRLAWSKDGDSCALDVDFVSMSSSVESMDALGHVQRVSL
ncbi:MAG: sucrose phosphorylase [Candidatus Limnocylindrales bacterium]|jgi:sucrose phosphorylase